MAIDINNESKNSLSVTNESKATEAGRTWDGATFTWDDAGDSTWDGLNLILNREAKNSLSINNEAKT